MPSDIEVSRGVPLGRLIAAADVGTGLTGAEMDPVALAGGKAVLTSLALGGGIADGFEVVADFHFRILSGVEKRKCSGTLSLYESSI